MCLGDFRRDLFVFFQMREGFERLVRLAGFEPCAAEHEPCIGQGVIQPQRPLQLGDGLRQMTGAQKCLAMGKRKRRAFGI